MRGERNYLNDKAFKEKMTNEERTMMEENMGLVLTVNQKFYNYDKDTIIDDDDMIQVGRLYLLKAIRSYNPEKSKVNGLYQIGFIKDGKTRMKWTPIGADKYDHNVKEVVISEATTGRIIETIIATH